MVLEAVTALDPLGSTLLPGGFSDVLKLAEVKDRRLSVQASLAVLPGVGTCITVWISVKFPKQLQEWEEDWDHVCCAALRNKHLAPLLTCAAWLSPF